MSQRAEELCEGCQKPVDADMLMTCEACGLDFGLCCIQDPDHNCPGLLSEEEAPDEDSAPLRDQV